LHWLPYEILQREEGRAQETSTSPLGILINCAVMIFHCSPAITRYKDIKHRSWTFLTIINLPLSMGKKVSTIENDYSTIQHN